VCGPEGLKLAFYPSKSLLVNSNKEKAQLEIQHLQERLASVEAARADLDNKLGYETRLREQLTAKLGDANKKLKLADKASEEEMLRLKLDECTSDLQELSLEMKRKEGENQTLRRKIMSFEYQLVMEVQSKTYIEGSLEMMAHDARRTQANITRRLDTEIQRLMTSNTDIRTALDKERKDNHKNNRSISKLTKQLGHVKRENQILQLERCVDKKVFEDKVKAMKALQANMQLELRLKLMKTISEAKKAETDYASFKVEFGELQDLNRKNDDLRRKLMETEGQHHHMQCELEETRAAAFRIWDVAKLLMAEQGLDMVDTPPKIVEIKKQFNGPSKFALDAMLGKHE